MIFCYNLFQFILILFIIFLQSATIFVFVTRKEYRTNLAYILMLSIAITDLFCLSAYFANLFCQLFGFELFEAIGKILNATALVSFDNGTVQLTLLALNRFITILRMYRRPSDSSAPKPIEFRIFITISAICWIFSFMAIFLFQTPLMAAKYDSISYNYSYPYSNYYSKFDYSLTIACPILILLLYIGIVFILKKNRKRVNDAKGQHQYLLSQYESRILLQSFIFFIYYAIVEALFLYIDYFEIEDEWILLVRNLLYTIYYGLNPCVYLATNSEFRQCFIKLFPPKFCHQQKNKSKNMIIIHVKNATQMNANQTSRTRGKIFSDIA